MGNDFLREAAEEIPGTSGRIALDPAEQVVCGSVRISPHPAGEESTGPLVCR